MLSVSEISCQGHENSRHGSRNNPIATFGRPSWKADHDLQLRVSVSESRVNTPSGRTDRLRLPG